MKIGIITFCEAVNYGAFLQAFSLGEFLKENDQDVEYITTRSLKSFYWNIHNYMRIIWTELLSEMSSDINGIKHRRN